MVTINLTILVQVGLFLLFLWAMHRLVFQPMLGLMDAREARISADQEAARGEGKQASELEGAYHARVAEMHRISSHRFLAAHRKAQQEHVLRVAELRQREDELIQHLREKSLSELARQRSDFPRLAAALADDVAVRLRLAGDRP